MLVVRRINVDKIEGIQLRREVIGISSKDLILRLENTLNRSVEGDWRENSAHRITSRRSKLADTSVFVFIEPLKYPPSICVDRCARKQRSEKKTTNLTGETCQLLDVEIKATRIVVRIKYAFTHLNILIIYWGVQFPDKPVVRRSVERSSVETVGVLRRLGQ